jgi:hypothetical protein
MGLPVVGKAHEAGASAPFNWFIYGSSLDRDAFAAWCGEHGYRLPDFSGAWPAIVEGVRLRFDVPSRFWGGAVAGLAADSSARVEGLVLPMSADARGLVEHKEGVISGLAEPLAVEARPLAASGKVPQPALAFTGAAARRLPQEQPPSRRFVETVIRGARASQLSAAWIASLEALLG